MKQCCPICDSPTTENSRYPRYICRPCLSDGVVVDGKLVPLSALDVYSTAYVECEVRGVRCHAREAHFGGIVVEPTAPSTL
jgi:hypothetical protein